MVTYCSIIHIQELDEILKIEFEWPNLTILDILYRFGPFNRTVWPYWRAFSFPTRTLWLWIYNHWWIHHILQIFMKIHKLILREWVIFVQRQVSNFFSYIMARTSCISMRWWWRPLCTRLTGLVGFYMGSSLGRYATPLGHILIPSQPV